MMNRRKFVRNIGLSVAGVALSPSMELFSNSGFVKRNNQLTILHTNDVHSHIDPFPINDPKYPDLGGFARRAALINKIRSEQEHVLLLDAGDIFQGTPYFNYYGGELEFKLMSDMKYDAATLGNHDFDNGIEGLVKQLPHASFPFLNVNYDFRDTELEGKIKSYQIIKKGKLKIGIFGVGVELNGLVDKKFYGNIKYNDPIQIAQKTVTILKEENKCDLVICLSHLGFEYESQKVSDKVLASSTKNIDLIIGGHTHTFLEKPVEVRNASGGVTLVNQVGWAGINLGRIDVFFNPFTNELETKNYIYEISKKTIPI